MCHTINQSINQLIHLYLNIPGIILCIWHWQTSYNSLFLSQRSTEQMRKIPIIALSITYKGVKFIDAANKVMTSSSSVVHPKRADKQPVIKPKPSGPRASLCAHHVTWLINRHTEDLRFIEWLLADLELFVIFSLLKVMGVC